MTIFSYNFFMVLMIKALSGTLKGKEWELVAGFTIGRSQGQIQLTDDVKVSGNHATFVQHGGQWLLRDNGSKNGIRYRDEKTEELLIQEGIRFIIGHTEFEIVKKNEPLKANIEPPLELLTPTAQPAPQEGPSFQLDSSVYEAEEPPTHSKTLSPPPKERILELIDWLETIQDEIPDQPKLIKPMNPALRMVFTGGLHHGEIWTVGYGPRSVGKRSIDMTLREPLAPDQCFELVPLSIGVEFRTFFPKEVQINGTQTRNKVLASGDTIRIFNTLIKVELIS